MMIACPRCGTAYEVDLGRFGGRRRIVQCSACDYRWSQPPEPSPAVATNPQDEGCEAARASAPGASPAVEDVGDSPGGDFVVDRGAADPVPEAPPQQAAEAGSGASPGTKTPIAPPASCAGETEPEAAASPAEGEAARADALAGSRSPDEAPVQQTLRQQGDREAPAGPQAAADATTANVPNAETGRVHRPRWRRLPRRSGLVAAIVALATAIAFVALLIVLRGPILAVLPASAGFYASFGLLPDLLGAGLEIRDVSTTRTREGSGEVLTVSGVVANVIDAAADVPYLRVSLYDAGDRQLQVVDLPGPRASLQPAEAVGFDVRISDLQPETRRIRVGFIAPPDPAQR